MAKILAVNLHSIPEVIHVGDNVSDITVETKIEFHDMDIQLNMDYCLHIFVYDIHGDIDAPVILPNWDESSIIGISMDRKDDFLGQAIIKLKAKDKETHIKTPIALKLGSLEKGTSYYSRKLEVFATVAPIVGRASKWSEPFVAKMQY